jgi:hypothetical protein
MFTFGRNHELQHLLRAFRDKEEARLLVAVVDSIHDLLDGKATLESVEIALKSAFIDGKSGVWERAGSWLLKVNADYPSSTDVWRQLTAHSSATVRFRVASFLIDLPKEISEQLYQVLRTDKSKKVREHAEGKWDYRQHPENYGL